MQYMLLIYGDEAQYEGMTPEQLAASMPAWEAFGRQYESIIKAGDALQATSSASTVRVRDGKTTVTDGPFAETREQLGGYYLLDCDLDQALEAAAACPGALFGSIELRPVMIFPSDDSA
ncbi:MAG: YciI family protein [Actinobacteria bacterium]|nr:YciI family protein [Thermoleophilia bacterium]MCB9012157.1 YciI family protein [Actinomycetota bacterium]